MNQRENSKNIIRIIVLIGCLSLTVKAVKQYNDAMKHHGVNNNKTSENATTLETIDASYLMKKLQPFQDESQNDGSNNNDGSNVATLTLYSVGNEKEIEDRLTNLEKLIDPPSDRVKK